MNKLSQEAVEAAAPTASITPFSTGTPGGPVAAKEPLPVEVYAQPQGGGSYICDPVSGALTKTAGPVPADQPVQE